MRPSSAGERLAAIMWFGGQALATLVWWLAMAASERVRRWFELSEDHDVLSSFVIADLVVIIGGSLATAWASWRRTAWAAWAAMATTGGVAYATLYLVAWVANGGDGWRGLAAMVATTAGSTVAAVLAVRTAPRTTEVGGAPSGRRP